MGGWSVDPQLMDLMRRLAMSPSVGMPVTGSGALPVNSQWQGWDGDPGSYVEGGPIVLPPNLIHLHRDELRQAASGSLDHMVIDVVAGLFDQILSDAKLPPLMAQQIARLQLPVLRAALGIAPSSLRAGTRCDGWSIASQHWPPPTTTSPKIPASPTWRWCAT